MSPDDFGYFDTFGYWNPKSYSGSYGDNGYHLPFASADLGNDTSGNNNDFTVTNLTSSDVYVDSPTIYGTDTGVGGELRANYATLQQHNNYSQSSMNVSGGNLVASGSSSGFLPNIIPGYGQWYFEVDGTGHTWDGTRANFPGRNSILPGTYNFGAKPFTGSAPANHKVLCDANLD